MMYGLMNRNSLNYLSLSGQAAADAKYYGHTEVYNILKARGAKVPVRYERFLVFKKNL